MPNENVTELNTEPKPNALQGLYLVEPHGRLIADHRKTLIAKSRHLPLEGDWFLLSKDNGRGLEYGRITVGQPRVVGIEKFDSLFKHHRVTPKERSRWWPTKIELYLYPITELVLHNEPKLVEIPAGTQTIVEKIKYLSKPGEPKEPKEPKEPSTDAEPGQDRERPYSEVGAPRASDTHSDPAEKEIEHEQKEARMPWTTADPPSCAKNWTESEKKKCITAANAVLRDGGKEQDAIFACIRAAGKTKYPGGKKEAETEAETGPDFVTLQELLKGFGLDEIAVKTVMKARGEGQGVGGPRQGEGPPALCVCPKCGHEVKHEPDEPCSGIECPECGTPMKGKDAKEPKNAEDAKEIEPEPEPEFKGVWSTAQVNDFPDSSFLFVEAGKKVDGKTTPRSLRHLPYKDGSGKVDAAHIRNAISRAPHVKLKDGSSISPAKATALQNKARAILAKLGKKEIEPTSMLYEPSDKGVNAQITTKGGRRLQSEKLSLLSSLKEKFESLLKDLGELIGWASYDDQKPAILGALFKESSGYIANKALDGRTWLLTWTTNAFEDREGEIFTTKSIEDYVARHINDDTKGKFDFWHLPGTEFGTIMWQGIEGRFLIESGPFDDTGTGRKAEEFFLAHPNGHSEYAPEGWGTSHQYVYREGDRQDGVYHWFEKAKTTILPFSAAANQHNPQQLEVMTVNAKQLEALTGIWGPDVAAQIVTLGKQQTEAKEKDGVAFKAKGTGETEDTEQKQGETTEEAEGALTKNKELVQTVAEELQLDELSTAFKAIGNVVTALAEQQKALEARMGTLEQDDETKLAQKETQLPRYSWFKASTAAETVLKEGDALKSVKPSTPSVVQNIAGQVT